MTLVTKLWKLATARRDTNFGVCYNSHQTMKDYTNGIFPLSARPFDAEMLASYQGFLATLEEPTAEQLQIKQMLVLENQVAQLEDKTRMLLEKGLKREDEISRMNATTEARFHALEGRVAEMQPRVLLLEASLASAGIQKRQRA